MYEQKFSTVVIDFVTHSYSNGKACNAMIIHCACQDLSPDCFITAHHVAIGAFVICVHVY